MGKGLPSVMPRLHCVVAARRKTLEEWPSSYDAILRVRQVMYMAYIGRCRVVSLIHLRGYLESGS